MNVEPVEIPAKRNAIMIAEKPDVMHMTQEELLELYLGRQDFRVGLAPDEVMKLEGKVCMVSGGAGSIGSRLIEELLKWILGIRIIVVDTNENSLYRLRERFAEYLDNLVFYLMDVRDKNLIKQVFKEHKPNIVFHFANYKSVVLGNCSPQAFVLNNIGGTESLLRAAAGCDALESFVFISSDKAQNPASAYGISKRLCEKLVEWYAIKNPRKKFCCVRYCNVLDAAGSFAIPSFLKQIASGENIKIRIFKGKFPKRFFIPIKTAVEYTLKAALLTKCGKAEVFSLNKERLTPLAIDDLVKILACQAGVTDARDVNRWFGENVSLIPAERGEKEMEILGQGVPVQNTTMIRIKTESPNPSGLRMVHALMKLSARTINWQAVETAMFETLYKA